MAKKPKKAATVRTPHLWEVEVRHRDYLATVNSIDKRLYMKHSTLFIEALQPEHERPSIDVALSKALQFLRRNQRRYGLPGIVRVDYRGTLDR